MALTNDFKIKNGLTVTDSISAGGNLSAVDGFFDGQVGIGTNNPTSTYKLDVVGGIKVSQFIDVENNYGLRIKDTGGSIACVVRINSSDELTLGHTSTTIPTRIIGDYITLEATNFLGIPAEAVRVIDGGNVGIGDTTPSYKLDVNGDINSQSNILSGGTDISEIFTTCVGDITNVSTGPYLTGGGSSGSVEVGIDSACASKWDTAAAGDISAVTATGGLSGGGTSGDVCVGIDAATAATFSCQGTVTCVDGGNGLTGAVTTSGSLAVGAGTGICVTANAVCVATACNTAWNGVYSTVQANSATWDNVGDITEVVAGSGLTGGGASGCVTLNVGAGTAITVAADTVGVTTACNTAWNAKTTCTGTFNTATAGLSGSGATVGINAGTLTPFDQSACPGINCTGTTTASNTQTFTNKSGNISQWTNDSGYTTCLGTTTASNTQTFTNKSGNISQWTNNSGYTTCTGTFNTAGAGLSASGGTVGLAAATAASLNQASCPGINCTGTTTASNTQTFTNKSGNISQWTNDCGYTTCTGDVTGIDAGTAITITDGATATPTVSVTTACNTAWNAKTTCTGTFNTATAGLSGSGATVGINAGTLTPFDQSACPGINCVGDVTGIDAGTAITITDGATATPTVGVTTACNTAWNAKTTCTGTVTSVATGSGLTGGTITTSGTLSVDSTVARTNVDETFSCDVTINGDLTVNGDLVCLETIVSTTSALSVVNNGSGPAITVNQTGTNDIVDFRDDNTSVFYIEDGGFVGLNCTNPVQRLDANGNINTSGDYRVDNNIVINTGRCFTGVAVQPSTDIADAYIASAATWNAKTTCTGTVTSVATGTGLTGGTITGSGTISILAACNTAWNAKTTCTGTVTSVTGGNGLTGSVSTTGSLNVGAGTGICVLADSVCIATACNTAWNAKTTCTGTFNTAGDGLSASGGTVGLAAATAASLNQAGCPGINCTGTTTASNTQTFTNKSGNISQWTNNSGYTTCTGTTTPSSTETFTNKSGNISQWTNDSGYTTCAGDVTGIDAGTAITVTDGATATPTVSVTTACNTAWNAKTTCTGTVTSVATGNGIDGGTITTSGTLTVTAGTGLAQTTTGLCVATACNTAWNAKTTCTGTVTSVTGGDGLTGTVTSSGSLAVDSTVVRTSGNQTITGEKTFSGSALCVSNVIRHTGDPDTCIAFSTDGIDLHAGGECQIRLNTSGVVINEPGNSNDFRVESDTNTHMLFVDGSANAIGINCSTPGATLAVNGSFTATCKSFLVDNPVTGGQLKYGVVEGNEHGVTVRGTTCCRTIELPEEWDWLVHEDSVTIQLTPVGAAHTPYVVCQNNKEVVVCTHGCYNYNIYGTRKDVEPLEVNIL